MRHLALLLGLLSLTAATAACARLREGLQGSSPRKAPIEAYVAPEFKNFKGAVFHPPEAAKHPWRVMMKQEKPRPKKNPVFRVVKAEEGVEIEMPAGSRFRCVVNPVDYKVMLEEIPLEPEGWTLMRTVRCSSDGWQTWSQAVIAQYIKQDGTKGDQSARQAELFLREVIEGKPTDIVMVLRPD
jgi:hypothetical protein